MHGALHPRDLFHGPVRTRRLDAGEGVTAGGAEQTTVRAACKSDVPAIFAIYDHEALYETTTFHTEASTPSERAEWWRARQRDDRPVVVAELGGRVMGWAALSDWSPRPAYRRTAEVSVFVDRAVRGAGVGSMLLRAVVERGRAGGVAVIMARIVEGNPASVRVHEAVGFGTLCVMRRQGEKFGRLLDVRLMERSCEEPTG
jgi:phosphinothricin acetyltransferase